MLLVLGRRECYCLNSGLEARRPDLVGMISHPAADETEEDQQNRYVRVCSVVVLDSTSEDTGENIKGLVESPLICDSESIEA